MIKSEKYIVNPNVIGKALVQEYGIDTVTKLFNAYRALYGKTVKDRRPVKPLTVSRYNYGGGWYNTNTASLYYDFLKGRLRKSS